MNRKEGGAFSAGFLGAIIGVISGAALIFFSDPKNRQKAKRLVENVEDEANEKLEELRGVVDTANKTSRKKLARNLRSLAGQLEG